MRLRDRPGLPHRRDHLPLRAPAELDHRRVGDGGRDPRDVRPRPRPGRRRAQVAFGETRGGKTAIIVTELPYQVNKASLMEKIAELVNGKRIEGIADLRDDRTATGCGCQSSSATSIAQGAEQPVPHGDVVGIQHEHARAGRWPTATPRSSPSSSITSIVAISSGAGPSLTWARRAPPTSSGPQDRPRQPRCGHRTIRESADVGPPDQPDGPVRPVRAAGPGHPDMRLARLAARAQEDRGEPRGHQLIAELEDILANPGRVLQIIMTSSAS